MEEVSEGARISLWNSLISGCERACEMATAEAQKGETRMLTHASTPRSPYCSQRTLKHRPYTSCCLAPAASALTSRPRCMQPLQTARPPSSVSPCLTSLA